MKVTVKDIPVRYNGDRYTKDSVVEIDSKHFNEKIFVKADDDGEDTEDYAEMTEAQLKKVNNDDLKAYLDEEEIEYASNATKDDLIELVKSE